MNIILQTSDFDQTGFQSAVQNVSAPNLLQQTITRWESWYINKLLGLTVTPTYPVSLAASFIADCAANYPNGPTSQLNINLYGPLAFQTGGHQWQSRGMKDILASLVFYEFIVKMKVASDTQSGIATSKIDGATKNQLLAAAKFAGMKYNDALDSIECLRRYLKVGDGTNLPGHGGNIDYPNFIEPWHEFKAKYFM